MKQENDKDYGKEGVARIAAERRRQIAEEGWTADHDRQHEDGELATAAALYASPVPLFKIEVLGGDDVDDGSVSMTATDPWPWQDLYDSPRGGPGIAENAWDKRKEHSRLRRLEIAGALIAAEIDRLLAEERGSNDS